MSKPRLRLVPGGREREVTVGPVRVVAAPKYAPPFTVDAVVCEEDTSLVLSAGTEIREPKESLSHLVIRVLNARQPAPGSVIAQGRRPVRLLAVVHDLDQQPSWREEWIASALAGILARAEALQIDTAALPLLGTVHGRLARTRSLELLRDALQAQPFTYPRRIWLLWPRDADPSLLDTLKGKPQATDRG